MEKNTIVEQGNVQDTGMKCQISPKMKGNQQKSWKDKCHSVESSVGKSGLEEGSCISREGIVER